jgi:hypothetical protein
MVSKFSIPKFKQVISLATSAVLGATFFVGVGIVPARASDHDDGETELKGRNLNLTDLYVFREIDQNPNASPDDLILIMNTNPRSLARQQYYFSSDARYEFKIGRIPGNDAPATGQADVVLRFEFDPPTPGTQQQHFTLSVFERTNQNPVLSQIQVRGTTTPLNSDPIINTLPVAGSTVSVFAGLREDPFFFDVEQYFRVRAGALGLGPAVGFRPPETAVDFATGYNVNAIAVRVPLSLLRSNTNASTYDVWETISFPGNDGEFTQVERLARPAINEGLVFTNDFLNALNMVSPDFEAAALAGQQPQAGIAGPIVQEVQQVLRAVGNDEARVNTLIGAFLPDVMRIDTLAPSGYGNALNASGSPIRGRMLMDDVIDITLSVVTNGGITTDNVSYAGTPGNPSQGHQPLIPSFPYLAPAN